MIDDPFADAVPLLALMLGPADAQAAHGRRELDDGTWVGVVPLMFARARLILATDAGVLDGW